MDSRIRNLNLQITVQKHLLSAYSRTSAHRILVDAREDGTVLLRGTAVDTKERDSITFIAQHTPGVTRVFCNISLMSAAQTL